MGLNLDAVGATSEPSERSWDHKDALLVRAGRRRRRARPDRLRARLHDGELGRRHPAGPADLHHHRRAGRGRHGLSSATTTRPCWSTASSPSGCTARSPPTGTVSTTTTVAGMYDKGSAGLVVLESESRHADSGEPAFTSRTALFIRGAGGFGGPRNPEGDEESALAAEPLPTREPDEVVTYATRPDQALLYRLSAATATRCTRTRPSPSGPGSTARSCTGCAPTASPGAPCSTPCAARTRRASGPCAPASPSRPCPATR